MPFPNQEYRFNTPTLNTVKEIGAVYGLFIADRSRPNFYNCLYVGETDNLRRRLFEHFNDPPIYGATHFFVEVTATERQRKQREKELIAEFNPPGNRTRGG
jgi:hypothetical protein